MSWFHTLVIVLQVVTSFAIIILVLLQHGKGADMGAAFGGGSSGSLFGASGSANFLSRTTGILVALFFCCTLSLTYFSANKPEPSAGVISSLQNNQAMTTHSVKDESSAASAENTASSSAEKTNLKPNSTTSSLRKDRGQDVPE